MKAATEGLLSKWKDASSWNMLASVPAIAVVMLSFRAGVEEERKKDLIIFADDTKLL